MLVFSSSVMLLALVVGGAGAVVVGYRVLLSWRDNRALARERLQQEEAETARREEALRNEVLNLEFSTPKRKE